MTERILRKTQKKQNCNIIGKIMESEKIMIKKIIAVSLSITLACLNLESVYAQGTIVEKEEQKFEENNRLDEAFMMHLKQFKNHHITFQYTKIMKLYWL